MKIQLRQSATISYTKIGKTVTLDLKDFLPELLKDRKCAFNYNDEELKKITSEEELNYWINSKVKEDYYIKCKNRVH